MAEWPNALVLKTSVPQGTGSSNLPLSAFDSVALSESQQDAISCSGNGLRLVVSDQSEDVEDAVAFNRSQAESAVLAKKWHKNEPTESGQSPRTVDEVRQTVQDCGELPDHIRAAVLALLSTL